VRDLPFKWRSNDRKRTVNVAARILRLFCPPLSNYQLLSFYRTISVRHDVVMACGLVFEDPFFHFSLFCLWRNQMLS